jgi:putative oxidoreductase
LLLAAGLLTPLGAAAVVGMMATAIAVVHLRHGFFVTNGGYEYALALGLTAAGLAFTGSGDLSVDHAVGWSLAGPEWGAAAVALGLATSLVVLGVRAATRRQPGAAPVAQQA